MPVLALLNAALKSLATTSTLSIVKTVVVVDNTPLHTRALHNRLMLY
jgi:predicted GTPase